MPSEKQKHSVIFLGTPDFAVPSLQKLLASEGFEVTLVITQPDKPVGRTQELSALPVKVLAEQHGIPVFQPKNINKEWAERPIKKKPDFLVVVAYGQILSQEILDEPTIAPVNVHASLLPRWRGASPIQHAILAGDTETGVTIQRMKLELDSGPILGQEKIQVDERATTESLFALLAELGAKLLMRTLNEPLNPVDQDDSGITLCTKLTRKDGEVDPKKMSAAEIHQKVRALVPWPGVKAVLFGNEVKLISTELSAAKDSVEVDCKDGTILFVTKLQAPGKKPMSGAEWKRGLKH